MEGTGPPSVGTRASVTRRVGRIQRTMTAELAELSRPTSWAVRGVDGPVRGNVKGTIAPLDEDARSRVTIELRPRRTGSASCSFRSSSARRRARNAQNLRNLKERLESRASRETLALSRWERA